MEKLTLNLQSLEEASAENFAGSNIGELLSELIPYLFAGAGVLLLVYLIFGGFSYITSAGDPNKTQVAKGTITNALIGFFLVFISYWIVQLIGYVFDIEGFRSIFQAGSNAYPYHTGR